MRFFIFLFLFFQGFNPSSWGQLPDIASIPQGYLQDQALFFEPAEQVLIRGHLEAFNQNSDIQLFCITFPNRSIPSLLKSYHQDYYNRTFAPPPVEKSLLILLDTYHEKIDLRASLEFAQLPYRQNWELLIKKHLEKIFSRSKKVKSFDQLLRALEKIPSLPRAFAWSSFLLLQTLGGLALFILLAATAFFFWHARKKKSKLTLSQTYSAQPFVRETLALEHNKPNPLEPHQAADAKIREHLKEIEYLALLRDGAFSHRRREDIRDLIERELLFFNNKYRDELSEKELKQLESTEAVLQKILKQPGPHLRCDFSYVQEYIHNFMVSAYSWEKYQDEYSPESIISTKAHFILLFNKTVKVDRPQGYQILNFYLHQVRKLENHPDLFLKKKGKSDNLALFSRKNQKSPGISQKPNPRKKLFNGGGSLGNWE